MKDVVKMVIRWAGDFIGSPIVKGIGVFVIEPDDDGKQKIIASIENIIGDIIATKEWKIRYDSLFLKKIFGDDPGETKKVDRKNAVYKFISFQTLRAEAQGRKEAQMVNKDQGASGPRAGGPGAGTSGGEVLSTEDASLQKLEAEVAELVAEKHALMVSLLKQEHAAIAAIEILTEVEEDEIVARTESLLDSPDEENRALAECGFAVLHNNLGNMLCHEEEWAKAAAEFDKAVRLDSSDASYFFNRGFSYYVSGESGKAVADYVKAAEMGNADAMITLGHLYRFGDGDLEDEAEGAQWYRKAAEQGNARGQCNLGDCYMDGVGVPKDEAKGAHWYRKAAEQGYARPQFALGRFYRDGLGVDVDIAEARSWFEKAAAQGSKSAQSVLRRWRARDREREPWLPF
jgi:TPR repeat protein